MVHFPGTQASVDFDHWKKALGKVALFGVCYSSRRQRPTWSCSFDITAFKRTISFMVPFFVQFFDEKDVELTTMNGIPADGDSVLDRARSLTPSLGDEDARLARRAVALKFLWFPLSYTALVVPLSAVRFREFKGANIGSGPVIFVAAWFALAGLVEFLLFIILRPGFGFAFD
jgi:hypothetical protein